MKKSLQTMFFLLGCFSLVSCGSNAQQSNNNSADTVTKQFCGVPPDMMVQLIRNYKNQVWSKTSDTLAGKYDARYMEISLEQLENFIAYAKQNAAHDGLKVAAVRFYYINYPGEKKTEAYLSEHRTGNVFEDYSGCHSLALVPVVGNDIHDAARRDYYKAGTVPPPAMNMSDFNSASALIFIPNNCGPSSPMENHNELCPPFKGCITNTLLMAADK